MANPSEGTDKIASSPFLVWNANFRHPFERVEHGIPPEQTWERHLRERGITHLIYSPEIARRRMEWSPAMHARFESWLGGRMEPQPIAAQTLEEGIHALGVVEVGDDIEMQFVIARNEGEHVEVADVGAEQQRATPRPRDMIADISEAP